MVANLPGRFLHNIYSDKERDMICSSLREIDSLREIRKKGSVSSCCSDLTPTQCKKMSVNFYSVTGKQTSSTDSGGCQS